MVDNSRIKTEYDIEILLGSNYFENIFNIMYDAGEIPHEIEINDNVSLQLGQPSSFQLHEATRAGYAVIGLPIVLEVNGVPPISHDATISFFITITSSSIGFKYDLIDPATVQLIRNVEATLGQPGLLASVQNHLNQAINREIKFDLMRDEITIIKFDVFFVKGNDEYQDALGIYINIRFSPTLGFQFYGHLSRRTSFLPHNRSFAIGIGKKTFDRFESLFWHNLPEERHPDSGDYIKPIKDGDDIVGEIESLKVTLHESPIFSPLEQDYIKIKVKGVYWIPFFPDADINIILHIIPSVQNGIITSESKIHSFDIDTGLFADFLAYIIVGIFGTPIGGIVAVCLLEDQESAYERKYHDSVPIDPGSLDSAFAAFPYKIEWDSPDDIDPFYSIHYSLINHVMDLKVDKNGLSYTGNGLIGYEYVPDNTVTIIDKTRGSGPQSWNGLLSLTYKTGSFGDIILPIQEILQRLSNHQLAQVDLRITHIHRVDTVVVDVRFNTGLELHVSESTALQDERALRPIRSVHIHAYKKQDGTQVNAHYRAYPGPEIDFEERPEFTPSD